MAATGKIEIPDWSSRFLAIAVLCTCLLTLASTAASALVRQSYTCPDIHGFEIATNDDVDDNWTVNVDWQHAPIKWQLSVNFPAWDGTILECSTETRNGSVIRTTRALRRINCEVGPKEEKFICVRNKGN
ncbi:MAG: hypothetical protein ABJH63_10670 [Rhizobiaceae bacterium]